MGSYGIEVVWDQDDLNNTTQSTLGTTSSPSNVNTSTEESFDQGAVDHIDSHPRRPPRSHRPNAHRGTKFYSSSNGNNGSNRHLQQQQQTPVTIKQKSSYVYNQTRGSHRPSSSKTTTGTGTSSALPQQRSPSTAVAGAHVYEEGWANFDSPNNAFRSSTTNSNTHKSSSKQQTSSSQRNHYIQHTLNGSNNNNAAGNAVAAVGCDESWADSTIATHPHTGSGSEISSLPQPPTSWACWNNAPASGDRHLDHDISGRGRNSSSKNKNKKRSSSGKKRSSSHGKKKRSSKYDDDSDDNDSKMVISDDERERRNRRRFMCMLFMAGIILMGVAWFLVYYFMEGKEKWSSQSASASTTVTEPTVSPAPTKSPSISPSASPTITAAPTPTDPTPFPSRTPTVQPTSPPTRTPTVQPTSPPTQGPTLFPTRAPTTNRPTQFPTERPTTLQQATEVQVLVDGAANELRAAIEFDPLLGPKFVRLGFHDCVGFCDGCVDMDFHDNFGLEVPIEALAPIVAKYERLDLGFTRADIWALSALVAADFAQEQNEEFQESDRVNFQMQFIGRQNCEDRFNNRCFGEDGVTQRECSATVGPFHHLPMADITTHDLFLFFREEFGFDERETVAIMGAHTLGQLSRENSGIEAPNGWVRDNRLLDNEYYFELVGGDSINSPQEDWIELAPPWLRVLEDNSDNPGFDDKALWEAFPPDTTNPDDVERIVMLNADIALVRELTEDNMDSQGRVSCAFTNTVGGGATPRCPHAQQGLQFAAEYRFDNELWLRDFMDVYHKMLNHGCTESTFCNGGLCTCTL